MATSRKPKSRTTRSMQLLLDESPEPMLVVDTETLAFLEVNPAACKRFGYSREEFRNMRLTDIVRPDDRGRLANSIRPEHAGPTDFSDIHCLDKRGLALEVDMPVHVIHHSGRKAALVTPQESTRRKHLDEQLRQAQKMEAVGLLAGGIAHDFNNLLTIINGYSQMLLASLREGDDNRGAAEQILKAAERAAELTRQLLTFSRRQMVRPKVLDLNAVIASAAVMLRRLIGEHIELRIVAGPDLAKVHADPGQLEQVIMNLTVNSRDAMPGGGTLILETQNVDASYAGLHATLRPGRYAMLAVTDAGSGMDAETRSHLFEPFFTTKALGKGTGLGLSTVHGIVKQSGGEITVYSEPRHGTCVKIYLPAASETEVEDTAGDQEEKAASGSETILLVEDDEAVRRLVGGTLEKHGYQPLVASTGNEALGIARLFPGAIQLLITDVVMPEMGGRQLAEQLKALRPELQVLYMSGYSDGSSLQNGSLGKHEAFLQKPFTPPALARCVRAMLDRAGGAKAPARARASYP